MKRKSHRLRFTRAQIIAAVKLYKQFKYQYTSYVNA